MRFTFSNLGPIDSGSIELGDITIICGPNNVGKSYITYAIYGWLQATFHSLKFDLNEKEEQILQTKQELITIDLKEYVEPLKAAIKNSAASFSKEIPDYFAVADDDVFQDPKIDVEIDDADFAIEEAPAYELRIDLVNEILHLSRKANEATLTIHRSFEVDKASTTNNVGYEKYRNHLISHAIADCLLRTGLLKPFIATSERTGIALFYKELDANKYALLNILLNGKEPEKIEMTLSKDMSKFARPILDNINTIREYENLTKRKGRLRQSIEPQHKAIFTSLNDILKGSFKATKTGVLFSPRKEKNREKVSVPVFVTASSIKALMLIDLFINHLADRQHILVIDEPEMNLHPAHQIKMAGLLARLANAGIKVIITTHSDYIIRELNNRIMVSESDLSSDKKVMKKLGYEQFDLLQKSQVNAYRLVGNHTVETVEKSEYGLNIPEFDETIEQSNATSAFIASRI